MEVSRTKSYKYNCVFIFRKGGTGIHYKNFSDPFNKDNLLHILKFNKNNIGLKIISVINCSWAEIILGCYKVAITMVLLMQYCGKSQEGFVNFGEV